MLSVVIAPPAHGTAVNAATSNGKKPLCPIKFSVARVACNLLPGLQIIPAMTASRVDSTSVLYVSGPPLFKEFFGEPQVSGNLRLGRAA
jgi:hypothetical protein